jgi:dGTPase
LPGAWSRHPLAYLVEAADDICYRIIDVEDAFRLQQLPFEQVCDLLLPLTGEAERAARKMAHITRPREKIEYLRAKAIGAIIDQAHRCFMDHEETPSWPAHFRKNCWTSSPPPGPCAP